MQEALESQSGVSTSRAPLDIASDSHIDAFDLEDFECKSCKQELVNTNYHCKKCETERFRDYNICPKCHTAHVAASGKPASDVVNAERDGNLLMFSCFSPHTAS